MIQTVPRAVAIALLGLALGACSTTGESTQQLAYAQPKPPVDPRVAQMYGPVLDDGWQIPAVAPTAMESRNIRQIVDYDTSEPAGTVVVDPYQRFLYLVWGRSGRLTDPHSPDKKYILLLAFVKITL